MYINISLSTMLRNRSVAMAANAQNGSDRYFMGNVNYLNCSNQSNYAYNGEETYVFQINGCKYLIEESKNMKAFYNDFI